MADMLSQTDAQGRSTVKASNRFLCRLFACSCLCGASQVSPSPIPTSKATLLGPAKEWGRKTLVLDLDETLVHSSLLSISNADVVLTVQVNEVWTKVYVLLRPGWRELLSYAAQRYEVVIYTASIQAYADQLLDQLDPEKVAARLYRDQCVVSAGTYVKDLRRLGRAMEGLILVDNSYEAFERYPENTLMIASFISDKQDRELGKLVEILKMMEKVKDVRPFLGTASWEEVKERLRTRKHETEEALPSPTD